MSSTDTLQPIPLDAAWISRALLLSEEAGWNQNAADWAVFFTYGTVLGFAIDDRLVATAAVLPYGSAFGWVSMVLVTAEWRRRGLATRLVAACASLLHEVDGQRCWMRLRMRRRCMQSLASCRSA